MLTDEDFVQICRSEVEDIDSDSDLSSQRSRNMDYYLGDMDEYLPAQKGRSSVTARDALDTVESVLPSLLRIFTDEDNAVEFVPGGANDEDQAKIETEAVKNAFYNENDGFLNLYTFTKDAVLSKTGIWKLWWEEGEERREEYEGLDPIEAQKLLFSTEEYELLGYEEAEDGINLAMKVRCPGKVKIEPTAPEEFGISRNANSPNPKDATFCYHRVEKTVSDLIAQGYDRKTVEGLDSHDEYIWDEEKLARRNLADEQDYLDAPHKSMRKVWVTECYVRVDADDDGIAELWKVTLGGSSNRTLLDREEVDEIPFVCAPPIILTHKFYGYSLVDLIEDIQEIRTSLFRGFLDNMYLQNNIRTLANERVNLDDLLVSRPGGVVRTEGTDPPQNNVSPLIHPPLPNQSYGLLEVLDDMVKARTGQGDEVAGLDSNALTNVNTGALMAAMDTARMRVELMARIIAELGLKEAFRDIHRLLHKNQHKSIQIPMNGTWIDVDPAAWREDRRVRVNVGLGHQSKQKKLMAAQDIIALQKQAMETGHRYVQPHNVHNAYSTVIEAHGMRPEKFFMNPATYQPPQIPPPPELMFREAELKLEAERVQTDKAKVAVDQQKVQQDGQIRLVQAESKERETQLSAEVERMKSMFEAHKMNIDEQNQLIRAETDKMRAFYEMEMGKRKQDWVETKDALNIKLKEQDQDIEVWQTKVEVIADLEKKVADLEMMLNKKPNES